MKRTLLMFVFKSFLRLCCAIYFDDSMSLMLPIYSTTCKEVEIAGEPLLQRGLEATVYTL